MEKLLFFPGIVPSTMYVNIPLELFIGMLRVIHQSANNGSSQPTCY